MLKAILIAFKNNNLPKNKIVYQLSCYKLSYIMESGL